MIRLERFSEPYNATGGLAAVGILNQLGRPDTEPFEVLVREAIQNSWDAKRNDVGGIQVEIGRCVLDTQRIRVCREHILVDPPLGLGLGEAIVEGMQTLYFADFGTHGLGGPTRADRAGEPRDFVDFVRNIGQPPDKDFAGGSFGYGKAAFYIASRAHTIVVDTLCASPDGGHERRLLGCALGENFEVDGRPYTGRHWWGRIVDGTPEPLTGDDAAAVAEALGLPERTGPTRMGTTVLVFAPELTPETADGSDCTMEFIADALAWNFWPRMIDTPGGVKRSMEFRLIDNGVRVRVPNPRTHPQLRGFVEAMDRMREEPGGDDDFLFDRAIACLRPVRTLGRLTVQKGPAAPADLPDRAVPQGARATAAAVHHVALMRTPEIVVKYLPGMAPVAGKLGYSGVFKCALDVDEAFKAAEPPTHDDWVHRSVQDRQHRSFVKIALERVLGVCREAAGYDASIRALNQAEGIPLGEFADALATLMPGNEGPGARRRGTGSDKPRKRRRRAPGSSDIDVINADVWVDGGIGSGGQSNGSTAGQGSRVGRSGGAHRPPRPPQARPGGDPTPAIGSDGTPVVRYPFELRGHGNRIRLRAAVEVMTNDGGQVESDAPAGYIAPRILAWIDPAGEEHGDAEVIAGPNGVDGKWAVDVELRDEMMMRVDIRPETV